MFSIDQAPESREAFQILPAGVWQVKITELELKKNKNGSGSHFAFTLTVVSPHEYAKCKLTHRCTYESTNAVAREIGHAELGDLLFACQIRGFGNVDELKRLAAGKEVVIETESEEDEQMRLWPRVINVWSLGGKHRNDKRSRQIQLGETGRPPRARKKAAVDDSFTGGGGGAAYGMPSEQQYNQGPSYGNQQQQQQPRRGSNPFGDDVPF